MRRLTRPLGFSRARNPWMCGHARRLQSNPDNYIDPWECDVLWCVLSPRLLPESARLSISVGLF